MQKIIGLLKTPDTVARKVQLPQSRYERFRLYGPKIGDSQGLTTNNYEIVTLRPPWTRRNVGKNFPRVVAAVPQRRGHNCQRMPTMQRVR